MNLKTAAISAGLLFFGVCGSTDQKPRIDPVIDDTLPKTCEKAADIVLEKNGFPRIKEPSPKILKSHFEESPPVGTIKLKGGSEAIVSYNEGGQYVVQIIAPPTKPGGTQVLDEFDFSKNGNYCQLIEYGKFNNSKKEAISKLDYSRCIDLPSPPGQPDIPLTDQEKKTCEWLKKSKLWKETIDPDYINKEHDPRNMTL